MPISLLTNKIIAYQEIPDFNTDDCVDWAIEMIGLGYYSEHILMLAGLSKPTNYFETTTMLKKALVDLDLPLKTGHDGIISYSSYYISLIADDKDVKANLGIVHNLCVKLDNDPVIHDFSLLRWGWDDLDYDKDAFPTYWEGATINNIEQVVIDYAKSWLETNKSIL